MSSPTHKPSTNHHHHHQSSLLDIPPISSPSATDKEPFDRELDKLLNIDDKEEDGKDKACLGSDSLEILLESASRGGDGRHKMESGPKKLLSSKENGVQESTKLSDLPGLSGLRSSPQEDDPLLDALRGSVKWSFDFPLLDSGKDVGLGKLPHVRSAPHQREVSGGEQLSKHKPGNVPSRSTDTFATEVPDYSDEFYSEASSHHFKENGAGHDLEDKRSALKLFYSNG